MKPEAFLLGIMDKQLNEKGETLFWYMTTAARLLYAQNWKNETIPMMEEWMLKILELAEMAKLTAIIREISTNMFRLEWNPLIEYLHEKEKNDVFVYGFQ